MPTKKNVNEDVELNEFKASDGQSTTADPVDQGSTSRSADKSSGENSYSFSTKSEVLSAIMSQISGLNREQLADVFKGLNPPTGSTARGADKSGGEGSPIKTAPTSVDGVTSAPPAGPTHSSTTGSGERNQIRTSPTSVVAKEDIEAIFAGEELSEELKEKTTIVFEAAVNAKLVTEVARLEEEFETRLSESVDDIRKEVVENVDKYLSYAVEQWVEENQVAIDSGLKVEMAEELIMGLKTVFENNYVEIPETKVDVVAEMADEIESLKNALQEQTEKAISLESAALEMEVEKTFMAVSEGLADTQVEKLGVLAEGISYATAEEYARKLGVIRETYFPTNKPSGSASSLNEEVEGGEVVQPAGRMGAYVAAASKMSKHKI